MIPSEVRFWSKVEEDGECWSWRAYLSNGYGRFTAKNGESPVLAHRWAYEQMVGEIPRPLVLDHLCLNRACVNPDHLDPVPSGINTARARAADMSCRRGHPWTDGNTLSRRGHRVCRTCTNEAQRRNHAKRKARVYGGDPK